MRLPVSAMTLRRRPRGAPLVQVIPIRRHAASLPGAVRAERPGEELERERIFHSTIAAEGWYRLNARARR